MRPEVSTGNFQVDKCSFTLMQFFMEHIVRSFPALQEPVNTVSASLSSSDFIKLNMLKKKNLSRAFSSLY